MQLTESQQKSVVKQVGDVAISTILEKAEKASTSSDIDSVLSSSEKAAITVFNLLRAKHIERLVFTAKGSGERFNRDSRKTAEDEFALQNGTKTLVEMLSVCKRSYGLNSLQAVLEARYAQTDRNNRRIRSYNRAVRTNATV